MTRDINYQGIDWEVGYDWEDDARTDIHYCGVKCRGRTLTSTTIFSRPRWTVCLRHLKSHSSNLSTSGVAFARRNPRANGRLL